MSRVSLVSRSGCHLCQDAEAVLDRILPGQWERIDIDSSIELERDFGDRVPVVLLDGAEHGYWRVDESRLLKDLEKPPGTPHL